MHFARRRVDLILSSPASQVGACAAALEPLHALIQANVLDAGRLHGDKTTVPLLAGGGTRTARLWNYVRGDRLLADGSPPTALFHFTSDRELGKSDHDISPVAMDAVIRIDAVFNIEREINGLNAAARLEARQRLFRAPVEELHAWLLSELDTMSKHPGYVT